MYLLSSNIKLVGSVEEIILEAVVLVLLNCMKCNILVDPIYINNKRSFKCRDKDTDDDTSLSFQTFNVKDKTIHNLVT